jgi:hypothetical protein
MLYVYLFVFCRVQLLYIGEGEWRQSGSGIIVEPVVGTCDLPWGRGGCLSLSQAKAWESNKAP